VCVCVSCVCVCVCVSLSLYMPLSNPLTQTTTIVCPYPECNTFVFTPIHTVTVVFQPVAGAAELKQKKFNVKAKHRIADLLMFLRGKNGLKLKSEESLVRCHTSFIYSAVHFVHHVMSLCLCHYLIWFIPCVLS
jgi:hypothetical protein